MKNVVKMLSDAWKSINSRTKIALKPKKCGLIKERENVNIPHASEKPNIIGTSICGGNTALFIADERFGLDAGDGINSLPLPDHLFISHHHEDHIAGLLGVGCRSARENKEVNVYVGKRLPPYVLNWIEDFQKENSENRLNIHYVDGGDSIKIDENRKLEFFNTNHSEGSLGISLLKNDKNILTYTGDINLKDKKMRDEDHLHSAENLIVEASYFGHEMTDPLYDAFGHSSFKDIDQLIKERKKLPKSLTYVHVPYSSSFMQFCSTIEKNMKDNGVKNVGYIPTCYRGFKDPMKPEPRKRIR